MPNRIRVNVAPVEFEVDGRFSLPGDISLPETDVHVWFVRLEEISGHLGTLLEILAPHEAARAGRFFFERDRNEYILTRGLLRQILGCYAGLSPRLLEFLYNRYGKPVLAGEGPGDRLAFSVSHSHGVAVYAITRGRQVGVDIEYTDEHVEFDQLAERLFSPREISLFRQVPINKRSEAFYSCWTRKEAYIKASGEGLSLDLRSFDVGCGPEPAASALSLADDPGGTQRWSLADLPAPVEYAAALAVENAALPLVIAAANSAALLPVVAP